MDEEDLAELAENQQVSTKSQFEGLGNTAEELENRRAGDLFDDLIKPKEDTMGVKILRKMGWREGQGVGPRVQRKLMDDMDDDDGEETYTLAPVNTTIIALERKTNTNGLGYTSRPGLEKRVEKPSQKTISTTASKMGMRGSMGIGVLNEDDDEDPYDVGLARDHYSRTVVPKRDKMEKPILKVPAKHTFTFKPKSSSTTDTTPINRRTHDGRLPLPGFSVSETPFTLTSEWYCSHLRLSNVRFSPPEIPEGWTPHPPTLGAPVLGPSAQTQLAPKDRGAILGEKPLPGKSVFAFLTPEARARISQATGNTNLPPALNEAGPESSSSKSRGTATAKSSLPPIPKDTAVAALNGGFMPYGDNPEKQKRYRAYLEIQAELSERPLVRVHNPLSRIHSH
jgi:G patch domain-containing protein 1